jgi:hypothetical protein
VVPDKHLEAGESCILAGGIVVFYLSKYTSVKRR